MKIKFLLPCILLLSAFIMAGCSKDKNSPAPPDTNCRIATIATKSGNVTITYMLSYDNDGRVSKISVNDFSETHIHFNYAPGLLTRDEYSDHWNGQLTSEMRAELNNMGLPVNVIQKRYDYTPTGQPLKLSSTITNTYEYNGQGELQLAITKTEYVTMPANNSTLTTTYTWSNGNIIKEEAAGGLMTNYEYYTDKPVQKGDAVGINSIINTGINPVKNKNLVKSASNASLVLNINYEYDETGKIKTAAISGNTVANSRELRYQYSCN